ncbi:MAG: hypothetical protein ACI88A_001297 [Paraglaciecola sp.]|jgi:hypothetical protein
MMNRPFSQACENNKGPISEQLKGYFAGSKKVLEIGSGTGQHAVYFAPKLAHLTWQTSDIPNNHAGINSWLDDYPADNLCAPISFTIGQDEWPEMDIDGVFTANTTHIMQVAEAQEMMRLVGQRLPVGAVFCQYGPFNVDGNYTSDSNRNFDQHLKNEKCGGIRDIAELQKWAGTMQLCAQIQMPANNFLLVWRKLAITIST